MSSCFSIIQKVFLLLSAWRGGRDSVYHLGVKQLLAFPASGGHKNGRLHSHWIIVCLCVCTQLCTCALRCIGKGFLPRALVRLAARQTKEVCQRTLYLEILTKWETLLFLQQSFLFSKNKMIRNNNSFFVVYLCLLSHHVLGYVHRINDRHSYRHNQQSRKTPLKDLPLKMRKKRHYLSILRWRGR